MKQERILLIEGRKYTLLISDEPQALLEAKASGRAVLGCMSSGKTDEKATDSWDLNGIPYVIPSIEYATDELTELILRRYLGLPWLIDETERLVIREFIKEDAKNISEEECLKLLLDFRRKHLCINRTNYCSITGVNKTHAILQLNSFIEKGMIHRYGSRKAVVYIQR